jgi:acetyltransferase-like isoleucine patch superfamily enzyme
LSKALRGKNVKIGDNIELYGKVIIGDNTIIENNTVIGHPTDKMLKMNKREEFDKDAIDSLNTTTVIGKECIIKNGTKIYVGARIGNYVLCGHSVLIREYSSLGDYSKVSDGSRICAHVKIGKHARIDGFCCDRSVIEDDVSMLGELIHKYPIPVGGLTEEAPVIEKNSVVGWRAIIIGHVIVHEGAYVGAGAIVTKDIPPYVYAVGTSAKVIRKRDKLDLDKIRGELDV